VVSLQSKNRRHFCLPADTEPLRVARLLWRAPPRCLPPVTTSHPLCVYHLHHFCEYVISIVGFSRCNVATQWATPMCHYLPGLWGSIQVLGFRRFCVAHCRSIDMHWWDVGLCCGDIRLLAGDVWLFWLQHRAHSRRCHRMHLA